MNEHDRQNLKFLLALSDETLRLFLDHCSADDYLYALELLMVYRMEIEEQTQENLDLTQANEILSKFRIKHE